MDALSFLTRPAGKPGPLYVLHGDESFLKRQALRALRQRVLGTDADEQGAAVFAGDRATLAEVFDELDMLPFFHPRRLVVVEAADPFVTRFRGELEKKVGKLSATGTLVLDVKTWPANTRLAKMIEDSATLACKAPPAYKLPQWCSDWTAAQYQKQLPAPAAALLVDLIGAEMGQLDQELLKLVVYVGNRKRIDVADVDRLVGNSRAENTWKIFDAIAAGDTKEALAILHRLFDQGEEPLRILGAFSMQLRRLAQATRLTAQGLSVGAALEKVGVPPFGVKSAEQQMRHLGRRRLARLYDWLLEMNLDLRGNSPLPERTLFERFLLRLARKNEPAAGTPRV
jgi:DNA polymerase III subunit delta